MTKRKVGRRPPFQQRYQCIDPKVTAPHLHMVGLSISKGYSLFVPLEVVSRVILTDYEELILFATNID